MATERRLRQQDIQELLSHSTTRDASILLILYETGCTLAELVQLRNRDIFPTHKNIKIGKKGQQRTIPLTKQLIETLRQHLARHPFRKRGSANVFYTRESIGMTPRRVEQILAILGKTYGRKLTQRKIRHASIVHAFLEGTPISEIEHRTGLHSIQRHLYQYHREAQQ